MRSKKSDKNSNKNAASEKVDAKTMHLALASPTPSARARKEEFANINALIKQSSSSGNMAVLKERRDSKETLPVVKEKFPVENPYASTKVQGLSTADVDAINSLIKDRDPGKLRERRMSNSKDKLGISSTPAAAPTPVPTAVPTPAPTAAPELAITPVARTPAATTNPNAKQRWMDAGLAVNVQNKLDSILTEGAQSPTDVMQEIPSPERAAQLKASTDNLTGAAARGAKAAALGKVKEAVPDFDGTHQLWALHPMLTRNYMFLVLTSPGPYVTVAWQASSVGGIFLTTEQWESMRAEIATLKVSQKRLETQLADARRELRAKGEEKETPSASPPVGGASPPVGSASGRHLFADASSFMAKAWAVASPMNIRPGAGIPEQSLHLHSHPSPDPNRPSRCGQITEQVTLWPAGEPARDHRGHWLARSPTLVAGQWPLVSKSSRVAGPCPLVYESAHPVQGCELY